MTPPKKKNIMADIVSKAQKKTPLFKKSKDDHVKNFEKLSATKEDLKAKLQLSQPEIIPSQDKIIEKICQNIQDVQKQAEYIQDHISQEGYKNVSQMNYFSELYKNALISSFNHYPVKFKQETPHNMLKIQADTVVKVHHNYMDLWANMSQKSMVALRQQIKMFSGLNTQFSKKREA